MCAHQEKSEGGYGNMTTVSWAMLVMGISLAIIILLYVWFGYMPGSNFSDEVMRQQQDTLRDEYGLPPVVEVNPEEAEIPPSLRGKSS